jgi:hypothetical protein
MVSKAKSTEFRGQRGGGLHSHAQLCSLDKIFFKKFLFYILSFFFVSVKTITVTVTLTVTVTVTITVTVKDVSLLQQFCNVNATETVTVL